MAIIFNSDVCGITKEQMKVLYKNKLIECNDFTFTVATIPDWAVKEAEALIGQSFKGVAWNDSLVSGSKRAIALKNKNDYPRLYERIMG